MRVVLDTNVVVSGLIWRHAPRQILDAARERRITLYTSSVLLAELAEVLDRAHFAAAITASGASPEFLMQRYALLALRVVPAEIAPAVTADPDDDAVLACALAAQVDLVVSGDTRLLNLKHYQRIPIVAPTEAIKRIPTV
ncbi:MAG: putative toxin-antitoxin system toxin component, PIN family [Burkholderiales bacterium]|nr:putative toxin-antitoxin system toxin component, PIN family [Burkholderiales bacterium]